jgi:sulfide dehydrogenase cytochrome subunit
MFSRFHQVAAASILLGMASTTLAIDQSLIESCEGCHGENGVSKWTDIPTIAGISGIVHEDALFLYRDGERPCDKVKYPTDESKPATSMCEVAEDLSDDQIQEIAAHYAALPFVAAEQETDADKVALGKKIHEEACEKCHTDGGSDPSEDASILAGQQMGYLRTSFKQFAEGRPQPKKMVRKLEGLSDQEIEALVQYYASQQ